MSKNKFFPATDRIIKECFNFHNEFNQKHWQNKNSFHDANHLEATLKAGEKLIKAALKGNDPLEIKKDLIKWNKKHQDNQIKQKELLEAVKLAFACHDLGNIAQKAVLDKNGEIKLLFLNQYKAKKAELRSQKISQIIIENLSKKKKLLPFIKYLIKETELEPQGRKPFGLFARVTDQIGAGLFNKNKKRLLGLLEEIYAENPEAIFSPFPFFNFIRGSFQILIPEKAKRTAVLKIWNKELPKKEGKFSKQQIKVEDFLNNI